MFEKEIREIESDWSAGQRMTERHGGKKSSFQRSLYSRGKQKMDSAVTRCKHLSSQFGRVRKREKYLRKMSRIVTLTEVFGVPWQVRVPLQRKKSPPPVLDTGGGDAELRDDPVEMPEM